ncbi:MAG: hypothetical protein KHZ72_00310 [Lachnospiraceae bacterium]|nr:hypothetical protein [Lachnospiraceae bacterium]
MKKIIDVLLDLLTVAFLAGAYIFQYFVKRKLGMVRWVNYKNMTLQEELPLDLLKYAALAIVVILACAVLAGIRKQGGRIEKSERIRAGVLAILAAAYAGVTVFVSAETWNAYYFVMPLLGLAVLMQILRGTAALAMSRKK